MIAEISSGSSLYGVIRYNHLKMESSEARVLYGHNLIGLSQIMQTGSPALIAESFAPYLAQVKRARDTIFHASINPHPQDRLDEQQLVDIAREYMERMGYGEQPYVVYLHRDIDRTHLHIVSCRIRLDGSKIEYKQEVIRKSNPIIRDFEQRYGLIPALESRSLEPLIRPVEYARGNIKNQIGSAIRTAAGGYACCSLGEYNTLLGEFRVYVQAVEGEYRGEPYRGLIYGVLDESGRKIGKPIKASRYVRRFGRTALEERFDRHKTYLKKHPEIKNRLRELITEALENSRSIEDLTGQLARSKIQLILRRSETGRITGVSFIDHQNRWVINGSGLGKAYSANRFEAWLHPPQPDLTPSPYLATAEPEISETDSSRSYRPEKSFSFWPSLLEVALEEAARYSYEFPEEEPKRKRRKRIKR